MKHFRFLTLLWAIPLLSTGTALSKELRIVLLGKSGSGKSATANTILGRKAFKEALTFDSVTYESKKESGEVHGREITVVDTPGLFDTSKTADELKSEVERCVNLSLPGPHVFLLVMRLDVRFTKEEKNAVKWIQENFGQRSTEFTIVLFTHVDQLREKSLKSTLNKDLQILIDSCGGRYHAFNNDEKEDKTQVIELLEKIDTMVDNNAREYYTNKMYQEIQRKIREEEERKRQEEKKKREEEDEKFRDDERMKIMKEEEMERTLCPCLVIFLGTWFGRPRGLVGEIAGGVVGYIIAGTVCSIY